MNEEQWFIRRKDPEGLGTGYLDLNQRIRDLWANLGEILFNAYGMKQYFELEEALGNSILFDPGIRWGRIDFEEWQKKEDEFKRLRNKGGEYPIPPVPVNLDGKQDFWLPTLEVKFRKIKGGSELPIPNDSNFAILFPSPLRK